VGEKEIEDALKRLDRLTREEARMAAAEALKLSHIVDHKVTTIDDKVTTVDNKVTTVDNKVTTVDNKVTTVDDKVTTVINGVSSHSLSSHILCSVLIPWLVVDDVKCLWSILSCPDCCL